MTTDLGDSHVLITGATGFVGQALLERLLTSHPQTTVSVLVRPKATVTAQTRVDNLIRKSVFKPWREEAGDESVRRALRERVRVVDGPLESVEALPANVDVVLHSASAVSFDPPIDKAFETNVGGATGLYAALLAAEADPHVIHISTVYVAGSRKGIATEARLDHAVDWRVEQVAAHAARERVEFSSRRPEALRAFVNSARGRLGKVGPRAVAEASEVARKQWVESQLVDWGRARAESLGWTDVYTFTKAMGERVAEEQWAGSGHRLSILRPSIIESALNHPYPGWIDGFKVADPLILAYGRGQLPDFPALPDSVLDIIPVDYVVNAILAVAASPPKPEEPQYFHVASGSSNPLPFHAMYENVNEYFTKNPIPTDAGPVIVPSWQFPGGRSVERSVNLRERRALAAENLVGRLPTNPFTRSWVDRLAALKGELETERALTDLYRAYVQTELIFDDSQTRALHDALPTESKADLGFDVREIDWHHYLQDVHFPSITTLTRAFANRSSGKVRRERPLSSRTDVVAVFDLEGTVLKANLVEQYVWLRFSDESPAQWPLEAGRLIAGIPRYVAAERRDRGEFIRTFLRNYKGMHVADIEKLVAGRVGRQLTEHLLPDALDRVRQHREAGHRTVLVTGSIDLLTAFAEPYFDEVVAGRMHERDGVLTGYLATPPLVDEARAAWLSQYALRCGVDLTQSYGYGDSLADQAWLQMLGHPTAVNPDIHLYRHARSKTWDVVDWNLKTDRTGGRHGIRH
ncbi:MAG: SDR family oxidoreductase [bacterium]|nr:SDR family oxidoreductase [bacterium]